MTTLETTPTALQLPPPDSVLDDAHLAAAAFLALSIQRGNTLDAYRHDMRMFFQWAADTGVEVLKASRPHIELYRCFMEARRLAALHNRPVACRRVCVAVSTVSPTSSGRIAANPAQYVRRPKVTASEGQGMDRAELGTFLFTAERFDRDHAALAVLLGLNGLRVSEACGTNIEDLGFQRRHRTLHIIGKGNKPALIPLVPRTARTIDLAVGERHEGPILRRRDGQRLDRRTAHRWVRAIGKRGGLGPIHPHMLRAGFIMAVCQQLFARLFPAVLSDAFAMHEIRAVDLLTVVDVSMRVLVPLVLSIRAGRGFRIALPDGQGRKVGRAGLTLDYAKVGAG